MFEAAELGHEISKPDYVKQVPAIRAGLLQAQRDLIEARVPLILIVSGADGAGKSETVNRLHEWFDPRGLETSVFGPTSDEERDRPPFWRFWRSLPPRGRVGIFFGSWYTDPIIRRVYRKSGGSEFDRSLSRIEFFEQELAQDGALIVKLWLHLSKKDQKKRLAKLEKDPQTRWRVSPVDWKHYRLYDRFVRFSEQALQRTDTGTSRTLRRFSRRPVSPCAIAPLVTRTSWRSRTCAMPSIFERCSHVVASALPKAWMMPALPRNVSQDFE